ncbi:MAG: tetratricopeptide repeat protein, partial [Myxococcales bacterium]|nr:tetratricopeptide repeat protein [Myxococcales bacterium]
AAEAALELEPQSPEAFNLLGFVQAAQGELDLALSSYAHAVTLDPGFFEAMLNAAELLLHPLGRLEAAHEMVDLALEQAESPEERADALLIRIEAFLLGGDRGAAAAAASQLPEGPLEPPHLEFAVARALFDVGDLDAARPRVLAAAQPGTKNPDAFYYLGLLLEADDDRAGSTVAFLESLGLDARLGPPLALRHERFERLVQGALRRLPRRLQDALEGALVVVTELPGAEVVAEGIDPRIPVLLDEVEPSEPPRARRLFVYQRNIDRVAGPADVEDILLDVLREELLHVFPTLGSPSHPPPGLDD